MYRTPLLLLAALCGSAQAQTATPLRLAPFSSATSAEAPAPWRVVGVPGGKIPLTSFAIATQDGSKVLRVAAAKSYGNLVHDLPLPIVGDGARLRWRWRLDAGVAGADLRSRQGDDSALKVCALFDMPLDKLGLWDRNLLRMARAASAEKLPSATLCYVWDAALSPDTLLPNAYTSRLRYLVVAGAGQPLGQWHTVQRNLAADVRRAFGAEADTLPPLMAVLVGADADNTAGSSLGFVGDVQLEP